MGKSKRNNRVLSSDSSGCLLPATSVFTAVYQSSMRLERVSCCNTLHLLFVLLLALLKPSLLCAEVRFAADRQHFSSTFSLQFSHLGRAIPILVYFSNLVSHSIQNISCLSQQPTRHGSIVFCTLQQICLSTSEVMQPCQIEPSLTPRRLCKIHTFYSCTDLTICASAIKCACAHDANPVVLIHAYCTLASLLSCSENVNPEANPAQSVSPSSISVLFCMHRKSNLPNPITSFVFY